MHRAIAIILLAVAFLGAPPTGVPLVATPAAAQGDVQAPDYAAWEKVAERAEDALVSRRASNTALEALRQELIGWRAVFLSAQNANAARIETLRAQIAALGEPPADGSAEPPEIAARRNGLGAQLAELEAPARAAVEAYQRADGLIRETSDLIRERNTRQLLALGPSPLNPTLWPVAWRELSASLTLAVGEVRTALGSETARTTLRQNLPATLAYLALAAVLLLRGGTWMERLTAHVQAGGGRRRFWGLVASSGQVILPVAGMFALAEALYASELLGFRSQIIADALPRVGLAVFGARWLSRRMFLPGQTGPAFAGLEPQVLASARRKTAALGVVWSLAYVLSQLAEFDVYSDASKAVLNLPFVVLGGYLLHRLGAILRQAAVADDQRPQRPEFARRTLGTLGRLAQLAGIAAPALAAVGYFSAALAVVYPAAMSLGLLGLLSIASGAVRDGYAVLTGRDEQGATEALVPVLVNLLIFIGSLPLFALIWGAQTLDLAEIWGRFLVGFDIGGTRISPTNFLTFAIVFSIGYVLTRSLQSSLKTTVLPKTRIDPGGRNAIASGLGYVGIFLSAVIAISAAGIDLSSLAIVAGALSVGIGFGLQNIVQNFVSGIILLIERPITEGDWIEVGGNMGYVRQISVRSTRIETFDRRDVFIPNGDLVSGTVINYTRGNTIGRIIVPVGVAYGTDTHKVQDLLTEIAKDSPLLAEEPSVHFRGFGADSLDFEIRAVLKDVNYSLSARTQINHEIARRFADEGIEIPFAQRDIWLRNPEALRPVGPEEKGGDTEK